jgi:hypothetical protein
MQIWAMLFDIRSTQNPGEASCGVEMLERHFSARTDHARAQDQLLQSTFLVLCVGEPALLLSIISRAIANARAKT